MADPKGRLFRVGDWGLDVPIPNPGLQKWLNSSEAKVQIDRVTREVFVAYQNSLPVKEGVLRAGARAGVGKRKYPGQSERYYGWVVNKALSYRPTTGQPYPRFIEYGKANADGTRTRAGHQLLRAAYLVAARRGAPAVELSALSDQFNNPAHHQARPAKRRVKKFKMTAEEKARGYREQDAVRGEIPLTPTQRRARRQQEMMARRNTRNP
jgi:hypothetical protein